MTPSSQDEGRVAGASTRRALIGGALAGTAAQLLVPAAALPARSGELPNAKPQIVHRGRAIAVSPSGRRLVVAHAQRRTVAIIGPGGTDLVDVGGQPLEVAIAPDGRTAAVTTASWDEPGLAIVDLRRARLRERLDAGPAPFGVAYTGDGEHLVVSGGDEDGEIHVIDTRRLRTSKSEPVGITPLALAPDPNGGSLWLALAGMDRVVRVDGRSGRIERSFVVARAPDRIAVSADGRSVLVSHAGRDADRVSEISLSSRRVRRHTAGRLPSAVGWTRRGSRLIALGGAGTVLEIAPGGRRTRHAVGGSPRGLAVAGDLAWTVDALNGEIGRVRT